MALLDHDNLEEFHDPLNYDCEFGGEQRKYSFFKDLAARCGGQVLELACGTGLTALPVAELGLPVTGIDLSAAMLAHARRKARGMQAEFIQADARSFRTGKRFALVYLTGNAFQAFLTRADQEALLATVRVHLEPAGLFAFETRNPSGTDLSLQQREEHWHTFRDAAGEHVRVSGTQRYDAIAQVMYWTTIRRWPDRETRTRIACRFTSALELAALLNSNGFALREQFGDWDRSRLTQESPLIISVCGLH